MIDMGNRSRSNSIALSRLNKAQLEVLLPHSGVMCLLDEVVRWDNQSIECSTNTHKGSANPLCHDGQLPIMAGVEYAAQAMAIHGTLRANRQERPRMGMLAVLSKVYWNIDRLDQLTQELQVKAIQINELDQGACYQFQLHCNGCQLLHGEAIIALQND